MLVNVTGATELFTYTFLHAGAKAALTAAESSEEGQAYNLLNVLVLSSFLVEAYFNHLGNLKGFVAWSDKKDRTSVWNKYKFLREAVGLEKLSINEAYPAVDAAIEFRNEMAHGRTSTYNFSQDVLWSSGGVLPPKIPVGWQLALNLKDVKCCFDASRKLILELHEQAGLGGRPFTKMASTQLRF
ncbi:hypothetical protein ALO80_04055 [Pseudomonas caricapapayae]|uniref:Uncharacterized protein n=1 Tax=Pseudomonas caricapapayae TaxID=46678 RepID=A0A0P9KAC4_9PSED|nr:hypothetical protein [Pseudomonas caricapapayae]KAA8689610.1 hypothetical protein F4W67_27690 [Pseudomonas caricapapayae]KPW59231.1 hypothetical protein ALO80_04055 [Pseudomonas caricapapayae]RMM09307.1 hypothetical protein ALQ84_03085 [Pseudomonas caricapapayae]